MNASVILFCIAGLLGLYSVIAATTRIFAAQNIQDRKRDGLSLLSAIIFLAVCGVAIYASLCENVTETTVLVTALFLLILNEAISWSLKYYCRDKGD
jgi:hypothetical protein